MMKICLVYPPLNTESMIPTVHQPLGLAYIASYMESHGYSASIIDAVVEGWSESTGKLCGLSFDKVLKRIRQEKPDIVGFSCLFSINAETTTQLAKYVKESMGIPTVIGGAHPTAVPEESIKGGIDYVILGEGEERFKKLVEHLEGKEKLENIDGLCYSKNGAVKINEPAGYIKDLDSLPFPARHLLPMEKYFEIEKSTGADGRKGARTTAIVTSRGCPFNCVFCSINKVWGRVWRARSPKSVVDEISSVTEKFGVNHIKFMDDNLTLDISRAKEIFRSIIDRGIDITWNTPNGVRADRYDDELLDLMKKSGCVGLSIGIESGDQWVSDNIVNKHLDLTKAEGYVKKAAERDIPIEAFFIMGFPGETPGQMQNTVNFAKRLTRLGLKNAYINVPIPLPGTRLRKIAEEKNLLVDSDYGNLSRYSVSMRNEYLDAKELQKFKFRAYVATKLTRLRYHPVLFAREYFKLKKFWAYARVIWKMSSEVVRRN